MLGLGLVPQTPAFSADKAKVLRYALNSAEAGFDPAQVSDIYSRTITEHIFEGLYAYDYLARPYKVKPCVAEGMPEVNADFTVWTIRLQRGIFFADDPAFQGRRRELVAEDFVYAFKRFFDPRLKSPKVGVLAELGWVGLQRFKQVAARTPGTFEVDTPLLGLRALDRHTLQMRFDQPRPRLLFTLAQGDLFGAVAREVAEHYGGEIMAHPVGTGSFRLTQWRRSSRIVLERNPGYREVYYDAEPAADDAAGHALLARFKGRRLPMVDRVEVAIIEEAQPRWLSFLNEEFDLCFYVPPELVEAAAPVGQLAPHLARRGMGLHRALGSDRILHYYNMEDPVLGGYSAEKVALRRALSLATNVPAEIRLARRGQAIQAQSLVAPHTWGYDAQLKTENSDFDLARARALLDLFGYVDRDGDGWRERPDGSPLVLNLASSPETIYRTMDEIWKKGMDALGIRVEIRRGKWGEQLKSARAGQLQIWMLGYTSSSPDPQQDGLDLLYGPASGGQNLARFQLARYDEIYRQMQSLPDGPQRLALLREAQRLALAYQPHKVTVHRIVTDVTQPWLRGFRRPVFGFRFWQYVDIDS